MPSRATWHCVLSAASVITKGDTKSSNASLHPGAPSVGRSSIHSLSVTHGVRTQTPLAFSQASLLMPRFLCPSDQDRVHVLNIEEITQNVCIVWLTRALASCILLFAFHHTESKRVQVRSYYVKELMVRYISHIVAKVCRSERCIEL